MVEQDAGSKTEQDELGPIPRSVELERRCEEAGIEFEFSPTGRGAGYVLETKSGREDHHLQVSPDDYQELLRVPFERVRLLNEYVGIYSYDDSFMEVGLSPAGIGGLFRSFRPSVRVGQGEEELLELFFGDPESNGPYCRWGEGSREFDLLTTCSQQYRLHRRRPERLRSRRLTLRIGRISIAEYDDMFQKMKAVSDACLLTLASQFGIALELLGRRPRGRVGRRPSRRSPPKGVRLPFPASRYDIEPISFYRYALSAVGMPLLQYLSFYQAIEFYFPRYSNMEAREIARRVLKSPSFSVHSDAEVDELVVAVKQHRASDASRNEKDQLVATLGACIRPKPLIAWVTQVQDRKKFFTKERDSLPVTTYVLQLDKSEAFTASLANRIYDLRCRIVHTKAEWGEGDIILPYSEAAARLYDDIELIRQVAEQVIAISGTELQLKAAL